MPIIESTLGLIAGLLCLSQISELWLSWPLAVVGLVLMVFDRYRVSYPFYGFTSVSVALILVSSALPQVEIPSLVLGFALLLLLRRQASPDLLPGILCVAAFTLKSVPLGFMGLLYFFLSLAHPLLRSNFYPRLPGAIVYRSIPLTLGSSAIVGLTNFGGTWSFWLMQLLALGALLAMVRSQRGMNLDSASVQESRLLRAEQIKESLSLIDNLAYSLHEDAKPEQVFLRVSKAMVDVAKADTMALIERSEGRWRIVSQDGIESDKAVDHFQRIQNKLPENCKALTLKKGWAGEQSAVLIPWEREGVVYLGRRQAKLESFPLLERLARLGSAAIRTAHQKVQKEALNKRGQELERWVNDLTGLLREVHFLGKTLEREDLMLRLKSSLERSLKPASGLVFSENTVEQSWGQLDSPQKLVRVVKDWPTERISPSPISGHGESLCLRLGESRLFLSMPAQEKLDQESLHFLSALTEIVGTFLSNSRLYSELRRTHLELEESQSELLQANKLAAIGQLAAGVAHELNSPFQAISIHLDLLKSGLEDEDDLECAETIQLALERCRVIVKELLNFSRQPSAPPKALNLKTLLRQAALAATLPELSPSCPEDCKVLGHDHELVSLFTNLLTNAKDAVSEKWPDKESHLGIQVTVAELESAFSIRVQDQGQGVPDTVKERIFEPFFTTKEVGSGTGLGLYMVYSYVVNAGGNIRLESQAGQGACFVVELPKA